MAVKKGKSSDIIYDYFKVDPIVLNGRFANTSRLVRPFQN